MLKAKGKVNMYKRVLQEAIVNFIQKMWDENVGWRGLGGANGIFLGVKGWKRVILWENCGRIIVKMCIFAF